MAICRLAEGHGRADQLMHWLLMVRRALTGTPLSMQGRPRAVHKRTRTLHLNFGGWFLGNEKVQWNVESACCHGLLAFRLLAMPCHAMLLLLQSKERQRWMGGLDR